MNYIENWREEKRSAYLYNIMAETESNILHRKLFADLKKAAEDQATLWENRIKTDTTHTMPLSYQPDLRAKLVGKLIRILGAHILHPILAAMKIRGMSVFTQFHSEHKHTSFSATSNLRAAVFGINDGLISNTSLILGMVGAVANTHTIIIAGIAGLLAGASSMAAGEYVSVKSQREVFEYQIALEKEELAAYPDEEALELALIYEARGLPAEDAKQLAALLIRHPETALDSLAREELGLNPEDLVSPYGAAIASFVAFAIGAFIPLLPFLYKLPSAINWSIGATGCALFIIGAILSLFTNKNPMLSGLRMLGIGILAGAVTYVIGRTIDVS